MKYFLRFRKSACLSFFRKISSEWNVQNDGSLDSDEAKYVFVRRGCLDEFSTTIFIALDNFFYSPFFLAFSSLVIF